MLSSQHVLSLLWGPKNQDLAGDGVRFGFVSPLPSVELARRGLVSGHDWIKMKPAKILCFPRWANAARQMAVVLPKWCFARALETLLPIARNRLPGG